MSPLQALAASTQRLKLTNDNLERVNAAHAVALVRSEQTTRRAIETTARAEARAPRCQCPHCKDCKRPVVSGKYCDDCLRSGV
jgi:hypothetical protein